jgi:hypothetical protein
MNEEPKTELLKEEELKDIYGSHLGLSKQLTLSKADNIPGKITILHNEPKPLPNVAPLLSLFYLIVYIYIIVMTELFSFSVYCGYILYIYSTPEFDFKNLFLIMCFFDVFFICLNSFYFLVYGNRGPEIHVKTLFICELIMSLSSLVLVFGFYLYLSNFIPLHFLYYFITINLLLYIVVLIKSFVPNLKLIHKPESKFFITLQYIFIVTKLLDGDSGSNWTSVFTLSYIGAYLCLVVSWFLIIISAVFFINIVIRNNFLHNWPLIYLLFIFYAFLAYLLRLVYSIVCGIQALFEENAFLPGGKKGGPTDMTFYYTLRIYFFIVLLFFFSFLILSIFAYKYVRDYVNANSNNMEISLTSFVKNLRVNMTQTSENYFQKNTTNESGIAKLETCYVCCDKISDTLITPCNHSGVCKDCVVQILITGNENCPMCKEKIDKIFVIFYDEEKKEYLSNAVINFK